MIFVYRNRVVLLTCMLLLAGCGPSNRHAVQGTVTLDGKPLANGVIQFIPESTTDSPMVGSEIRDGTFSIARDRGPFVGEFRVEITSAQQTSGKMRTPSGELIDAVRETIPARYNIKTTLTAKVTEQGPNDYEFALRSE